MTLVLLYAMLLQLVYMYFSIGVLKKMKSINHANTAFTLAVLSMFEHRRAHKRTVVESRAINNQ